MKNSTRRLINIVMAILVSVAAWVFVVYNYYPMTDIKYNDVSLSFAGERALADRGLAVSEASTEGISVTLDQKRVDVNKITKDDIKAELDVSDCLAGDNKVSPNVSGPKETSVADFDNKAVDVVVERTDSEYLDIDVIYSGDAPENAAPIVNDLGQTQAEVVCAASKLSSVKKVAAVLNYDEVGKNVKSYTANLVALDKNGNEVPHVVIYPDEISLDASAGIVKTVNLTVPVKNESDEQYERKYTVPDKITIIGPKEEVEKLGTIRAEEIDISYYYEDSELAVECNLPEGVEIASGAKEPVLKLSVTKKPQKASEESKEQD